MALQAQHAPPRRAAGRQLRGLLWRHWLAKRRSWCTTAIETLSPVLILGCLVLAYRLVDREYRAERIRVNDTLRTVKELKTGWQDWSAAHLEGACGAVLGFNSSSGSHHRANGSVNATETDPLQARCQDEIRSGLPQLSALGLRVAQSLINRNGPLPLLTLDEFILLHESLSTIEKVSPGAFGMLRNVQNSFGMNLLGNLLDLGQVAFVPETAAEMPAVLSLADHMLKQHTLFPPYFKGVFETEADAEAYAMTASPRLWALVTFARGPDEGGSEYTIRMNFTTVPSSRQEVNRYSHGVPRGYKRYYTSGFMSLQAAIESYSLTLGAARSRQSPASDESESTTSAFWTSAFPTSAYYRNVFYQAVGPILGLLTSLSLVYPLSQLARGIVQERETRAQATMEIMGMPRWAVLAAWAVVYGVILGALAVIMTVICCASFLSATQWSLVLAVFLAFAFSQLGFGVLVSSFISNAKMAAIAAPLLQFSLLMPRYIFYRTEENQALGAKVATSLLAPTAFAFATDLFAKYEAGDLGLQWTMLWDDPYPLGAMMAMLLVDGVLYFLLVAAIQLLPLVPRRRPRADPSELLQNRAAVEAIDLTKVYGSKVAVSNVSMTMQMGEITALLGHNGAGKSTVVGLLTGLEEPTSGCSFIVGRSLHDERASARQHIGYCPQANVLFSSLTVYEHLLFFAAVKCLSGKQASAAAEEMLQALDLAVKKDAPVNALSGGMKRRLQVAIALLGRSEVVILDEPTCGVDPKSRREIWALLARLKQERAILLITHHTDEADILSDQVAIMVEGRLVAMKPPLLMKQHYGDGYMLSMILSVSGLTSGTVRRNAALVQQKVPGAVMVRSAAAELVFRLPLDGIAAYPDLLETLESNQAALSLEQYSISMPTLEEAFLEASASNSHEGSDPAPQASSLQRGSKTLNNEAAVDIEEGHSLLGLPAQDSMSSVRRSGIAFMEMVKKRMRSSVRDWRAVTFVLVLPLVVLSLLMLVLKIDIDPSSQSMLLDLSVPPQVAPISAMNLPAELSACRGSGLQSLAESKCKGGYAFEDRGAGDAEAMSHILLQDVGHGIRPQYAAVVFNDSVIRAITDAMSASPEVEQGLASAGSVALAQAYRAALPAAVVGSASLPAAARRLLSPARLQVLGNMLQRLGPSTSPINLMHNASAQHAMPSLLSGMHATLAAVQSGGAVAPRFVSHSHPLPLSLEESVELDSILMVLVAMLILVPFCMLSGAFSVNPVVERTSRSHHLQLLSGCPPAIYWAGSLAWDVLCHSGVSLIALFIFAAFGDQATTGSFEQTAGCLVLLLCYGAAVVPLTYCYSFAFQTPSAAQLAASALNFLFGFCAVTASYVMAALEKTQALQRVLVHFFRMMPPFLLGEALIELTRLHFLRSIVLAGASIPGEELMATSVFSWSVLGRPILLVLLETLALSTIVLAVDAFSRTAALPPQLHALCQAYARYRARIVDRLRHWIPYSTRKPTLANQLELHALVQQGKNEETLASRLEQMESAAPAVHAIDDCVAAEKQLVDMGIVPPGSISIQHLSKKYSGHPPKLALGDLCLTVKAGETFGLLGANGAGKSTLLGVLTKSVAASSGRVLLDGSDELSVPLGTSAGRIGFCPQTDPLIGMLSAREQIAMFARLKGVEKGRVGTAVEETLVRVALPDEMSRRPAWQYSGGNKRKLALGIALVGGIRAILLDEPSSGVDPGSRRAMWTCIRSATMPPPGIQESSTTTVLTTHSMEECEALCSRVGILHSGRLVCLGSLARLRATYADGFILEVYAAHAEEVQQAAIVQFVEQQVGGTKLDSEHRRITFSVPHQACHLPTLFRRMEAAKHELDIAAYGLHQPSLEQVFLKVVGEKIALDEESS